MDTKRSWDIFCRVIDNFGDIGVCWRLAADLARREHQVRLWVDDTGALAWMAPGALEGRFERIEVRAWAQSGDNGCLADLPPADVWVEGFGCELDERFVARRFSRRPAGDGMPAPAWINLEYLSAESFAARSHGLPSPILHGPAQGHTRWFFYPGFLPGTGGLLREPDLTQRLARFDRAQWLASHQIPWSGERLVSLFCYEPKALGEWLDQCRRGPHRTRLLVTPGRATAAIRQLTGTQTSPHPGQGPGQDGHLSLSFLPALTQADFDHLLWASDLNFVRGEDSFVRALWAGRAFVWQIYPQDDGAHHPKLEAALDMLQVPDSLRSFHRTWNGISPSPLPAPDLTAWQAAVATECARLAVQSDLTSRLTAFVDALPPENGSPAEWR